MSVSSDPHYNRGVKKGIGLAIAILLLGLPAILLGQESTIKSLVQGEGVQRALKFADLTSDYKAARISMAGGQSDVAGWLGAMTFGMGHAGTSDQARAKLLAVLGLSWTKGDRVKVGGNEFLVTFKPEVGVLKDAKQRAFGLGLRLMLLRSDMIASIAPQPEFSKADLLETLDATGLPYDQDMTVIDLGDSAGILLDALLAPPVPSVAPAPAAPLGASDDFASREATGMMMYLPDYDGVFPYAQSTATAERVIQPYVRSSQQYNETSNSSASRLLFNMSLAGAKLSSVKNPASTPMFYESSARPDGTRRVAFCDGHSDLVSPPEWAKLEPLLHQKLPKAAKRPLPPD